MTTIEEVIRLFDEATFYYEILTDKVVNGDATTDSLYGHYLDDFIGFETNSYDVIKDKKQYLTMTLTVKEDAYCEEDADKIINVKNLTTCFNDNMITKGKFNIPGTFTDSIYPIDPRGIDQYLDSIDVTFKFYKVDNPVLRKLINIVNCSLKL